MASATTTRSLCRTLIQISRQAPLKRKRHQAWQAGSSTSQARLFSVTSLRADDQPTILSKPHAPTFSSGTKEPTSSSTSSATTDESNYIDFSSLDTSEFSVPTIPITARDLSQEARADYDALPTDQQPKYLALENHFKALTESPDLDNEFYQVSRQLAREVNKKESFNFPNTVLQREQVGFWAESEDDEFGRTEDGEDHGDDNAITSVAESQLEVHRETRDYTRIAAWDMPLLTKFAKPFEPPAVTSPLRFRYTTYMGEHHPAQKKVVVQFCTRDLPDLTEAQRIKLCKLVGVRYNPDTDVVKMSCEKFEAPAQNKRYLGDMIGKLITEAKDGKDTFEDVPLDLRHHKPKKTPIFPEEWKITPERVRMLLNHRNQTKLLEETQTSEAVQEPVLQYARATSSRILA